MFVSVFSLPCTCKSAELFTEGPRFPEPSIVRRIKTDWCFDGKSRVALEW
jgi:hypothetical protein